MYFTILDLYGLAVYHSYARSRIPSKSHNPARDSHAGACTADTADRLLQSHNTRLLEIMQAIVLLQGSM